ncbi:hypothetical protein Sta7437_4988 (plasmid) [Stanieria cyanosphaera PCC 7437]|uniref:DNA-directed DNA polymerase n=1 Tax=Stanieria cyanosphaera (strain ATCC 29371 / PCC 7437) TaxID=111780 RepID=K9Y0Y7_STAC7|nr:hypothetical protein [Stanieria cyanosphaera]AFZ38408.1 hypothetical protein Sta7437_4988 [Stanieria cyanosphaera PCC 7437]
MFYQESQDYIYTSKQKQVNGQNLYFPVEIDTEYTHLANIFNTEPKICTNITVQCKAIGNNDSKIYSFSDIRTKSRHKPFQYDFVVWDYLNDLGHQIQQLNYQSVNVPGEIPWLQVDCYSFFAVAEYPRVFMNQYRQDFKKILLETTSNNGIEQGRRLRTFHREKNRYLNWIETPWLILLDNYIYRVRLSIYDTSAVHGNTSYKNFCTNSGLKLDFKDNFTSEEKSRMLDMYDQRPEDFDNYALGDLYNHNALLGNVENFKLIYQSLGLENYYTIPKLTIGATVSRIIESAINKQFNAPPETRDFINKYCKYGSADYLKRLGTTGAINAKVDGGRCRNNRPLDTFLETVICNPDIAGCYGNGLRIQTYPLGVPSLLDYPRNSTTNKYLTLRQFLKKYNKEFVPGLWQARISLKDDYYLKYQQDYFISWIPPKDIRTLPTDTEISYTDQWWEIDDIGTTKIFKNDIQNALLNHDGLQWIEHIASTPQRKELLDNLIVITAMWYSANDQVNSIEELVNEHTNHKGKNTTEIKRLKGKQRKISIHEECHKWYGINLGKLVVDKLLLERQKHPKKTPFNELYKLCVNTIYGDMVSPFFRVGNVVVGNNITARARAYAWYMEKGFNSNQTITDGGTFDMNAVTYSRNNRQLNGTKSVHLYLKENGDDYYFKPLNTKVTLDKFGKEIIKYFVKNEYINLQFNDRTETKLNYKEAIDLYNIACHEHLQSLFNSIDVLHQKTIDLYGKEHIGQYKIEIKDFSSKGCFHGSANYRLYFNGNEDVKMRSYSKGAKDIVVFDGNELVYEQQLEIVKEFLCSLENSQKVQRSKVFINQKILKVGDYRKNRSYWENTEVIPGYTIYHSRLLREFSLSQFTFNTYQQYLSWKREYDFLLRHYTQSYEMFYLDNDGDLNYQQMIEDIEESIRKGDKKYTVNRQLKNRNTHRLYQTHKQQDALLASKEAIDNLYKRRNDN